MYKILVVEDDLRLSQYIKEWGEKYNYEIFTVKDFKEVNNEFNEIKPHIMLLDINLPYYDGFYLCKTIRRKSSVPIIIISARDDDKDQILAMEIGADDYIVKPFKIELLLAKVKAVIRRNYEELSRKEDELLNINGLILDKKSLKINFKGKYIELTKNEFMLLQKLMENKNEVIKRDELLELLWDDSSFVVDNTLSVNVTRVKNKLKELGIDNAIKTKRGYGYSFDSDFN